MEVAEISPKFASHFRFSLVKAIRNMRKIDPQKAVMNSSHYDYILHNNKKSIVIFNGEPR